MTRTVLAALALLVAGPASAQAASVVVSLSSDEYSLSTVSDDPLDEDFALLLSRTEAGAWVGRMLKAGDVPSEVAALRSHARLNPPSAALDPDPAGGRTEPRIAERPRATSGTRVRYVISLSRVPADAVPNLLADADGEAPFTRAEVQTRDGRADVEMTFVFASIGDWSDWNDRVRLGERFAADPSVLQRTQIDVFRPWEGGRGDGVEDVIDIDID